VSPTNEAAAASGDAAYEARLADWIARHAVAGDLVRFAVRCHTVAEAAAAAGAAPEDLVKNICLIDASDRLIVAIVKGTDRVSTTRIGNLDGGVRPRLADPDEILARTGFPCGGTPSFGYPARFMIDPRVMEHAWIWTGGGSQRALVRIAPRELLRANGGEVARVRK